MALIDNGSANWGCYGPSLVPVLPQAPGGAQHPPVPPTSYGPGFNTHWLMTTPTGDCKVWFGESDLTPSERSKIQIRR